MSVLRRIEVSPLQCFSANRCRMREAMARLRGKVIARATDAGMCAQCLGNGSGRAGKCVDELLYFGSPTLHLGRRNVGRQGCEYGFSTMVRSGRRCFSTGSNRGLRAASRPDRSAAATSSASRWSSGDSLKNSGARHQRADLAGKPGGQARTRLRKGQ